MPLNMDFVRSRFAGLDRDWIFLDNAGGSLALEACAERVAEYLRETPVQLGGNYPSSQRAAARQEKATSALARMVNAAHEEEIVLGGSATALTWRVARALLPQLEQGDEIIVTRVDHEANRSPWLSLRRFGIVIREVMLDRETWQLDREQLRSLLGPRTKLVAIGHCSNILGSVEPVADIAAEVHEAGAKLFVDSVAYAPHRPIDVQALGADFCVLSLYKIFGPHLGLLWGKRDELVALANLNHEYLDDDAIPYKLQPGGASYELVHGAGAVPEYLEALDRDCGGTGGGRQAWQAIRTHEDVLQAPVLELLANSSKVELLGKPGIEERVPIIGFRPRHESSAAIVTALQERQLACRSGHFHARRLLESMRIEPGEGVVRISFAHYNTVEESAALVTALEEVIG